jgi:FKBP-type peptidyl-prolyl cis-trans isomerase (trigger factor)
MVNTADERYYTGLETALLGAKRNEATTLDVTFSDEAMIEELKGRTLSVTATVSSIQAMSTPALDDDMAAQLGFEGGADGMRAAVQLQIQEAGDAQARNQARANLLNVLIDGNEFSAPAGLIDQQLKALLEEIRIQRAYRGENPRDIQFSDSELADYRTRATFAAKASLILDHVAKAESIGVEDGDLEAKYQEIADARGQRVEAIKGYFVKENAVEDLRERLLEEKTLDWLLERATLVDPKPADEAPAEAAAEAAPAKPKAKKATKKAAAAEEAPAADAPKAELEGRPYKGHVITGKSGSYQIDGEGPNYKTLKDAKASVA